MAAQAHSDQRKQRTRGLKALLCLPLLAIGVAACGSTPNSGTSGSATAANTGKTTPEKLAFTSAGVPVLKGVTLKLGNAGSNPSAGDTVSNLVATILQKWGANVTYTLGSHNTTELAVLSGNLDSCVGPMATELNAGLVLFGPNQLHISDSLVSKSATSLKQLVGKSIAVASPNSPSSTLNAIAIANAGLGAKAIKTFYSGSDTAAIGVLVSGSQPAAWVHASAVAKLTAEGFHVLETAYSVVPALADSYRAATASWVKQHPAYAEAINLAWIEAANTFRNHPQAWLSAASTYTKGADSSTQLKSLYTVFKAQHLWTPNHSAYFTPSAVAQDYKILKPQGAFKGQGVRAESAYASFNSWNAAVNWYQAHQSAYSGL